MKGNLKSQTVVWKRKYFGANGEGARDSFRGIKTKRSGRIFCLPMDLSQFPAYHFANISLVLMNAKDNSCLRHAGFYTVVRTPYTGWGRAWFQGTPPTRPGPAGVP